MGGLTLLFFAAVIAITIFDIVAVTHGVDSRPEFEDPRAPVRGISN